MTVRSKQLCRADISSGSLTTEYTVPTGYRTIIRSIVAQNHNAAANRLQVALSRSGIVIAQWNLFMAAVNTSGDTVMPQPWVVMEAGDDLRFAAAANGVWIIVSGPELKL